MTKFFITRCWLPLLCLQSAFPIFSAQSNDSEKTLISSELLKTNVVRSANLKPGPDDPRIANLMARLLQQYHYSRHPFDDEISSKFLTRYTTDLDPQRLHFLQTDIAEFETYRDKLDDLILKRGDTSSSCVIFTRFLERIEQHIAYVNELLKADKFNFKGHEHVTLNRKDLPYPKDLTEAKKLWRDWLRNEYLEEKLALEMPPEKTSETNKPVKIKSAKEIHEKIVETLTDRYKRTLKNLKERDSDDVLEGFLTTLAHVYDPHSDYMGKSQAENFAIQMNLALFGIGAKLTSDGGFCKISELVPGPALKSRKVKPNDKIIAVAQSNAPPVDVVDMPLNKVVSLIRGPKGTEVRLTIIPADAPSTREVVSLIREEIKLEDQEAKGKIIELPSGKNESFRLGVIDLPSFYASMDVSASTARDKSQPRFTSIDVTKLLNKFKEEKVSGVILDLRRNGGGSLEEAIKLTGLFIKQGPVVQVKDYDSTVNVKEDKDPSVLYDGPLLVLTSRFSASASEIVAGALQDYGRALIVGESSTHGKGTVQTLLKLESYLRKTVTTNDPGDLKVTVQKFYRPSGSSTQLKGVVPDIVLPSKHNVWEIGEASLENPLPWDPVESAKFEHLDRVSAYLEDLRKHSAERVASEREFDYEREDIENYQKHLKDKTVSLNEAERLKERAENDARKKARNLERSNRKEPDEKVYDITLKLADKPGLPAPTVTTNSISNIKTNGVEKTTTANSISNSNATTTISVVPVLKSDGELEMAAQLAEAEHILTDYLSLLPKETILTINHTPVP